MSPFRIVGEQATKKGVTSLLLYYLTNNSELWVDLDNRGFYQVSQLNKYIKGILKGSLEKVEFKYMPPYDTQQQSSEFLKEELENILKNYHTDVDKAENQRDSLIHSIARLTRRLELLHPFQDGNGRVFVNLMLNGLLLKHGFLPATFYESNIFDLYDELELVDVIKESMATTLHCIVNQECSLFGYKPSSQDLPKEAVEISSSLKKMPAIDQEILAAYRKELADYCKSAWDGQYSIHQQCALGTLALNTPWVPIDNLTPWYLAPGSKNKSPLHLACLNGHAEIVEYLAQNQPSLLLDEVYKNELVLPAAIKSQNLQIVKFLMSFYEKNLPELLKIETLLDTAAKVGNAEIFHHLIQYQTNKPLGDLPIKKIASLMSVAASANNQSVLREILAIAKTEDCLHCYDWKYRMANLLKENSYKTFKDLINYFYPKGGMPFQWLSCFLLELLDSNDIDLLDWVISKTDLSSKTESLDIEVFLKPIIIYDVDDRAFLRLLEIEKNPTKVTDPFNTTIMSYIASLGKVSVLKLLEKSFTKADYYCLNDENKTPLVLAASNNHADFIRYMINNLHVNPNKKIALKPNFSNFYCRTDSFLDSPLTVAIKAGHLEAAKALVECGATIGSQEKEALPNSTQEISEFIKEYTHLMEEEDVQRVKKKQ